VVERLIEVCDAKRLAIVQPLLEKLNGKLTDAEKKHLEKAFQRLQNQLLDGPISALTEEMLLEETRTEYPRLEWFRKLFRLHE
jgi:hypothetical protein